MRESNADAYGYSYANGYAYAYAYTDKAVSDATAAPDSASASHAIRHRVTPSRQLKKVTK